MSDTNDLDNSPRARRFVRTVSDLYKGDLRNVRVLDLGCAHGLYALEFAKRGADVVGIEGRESWVNIANQSKTDLNLPNVTFFQDDARNLSRAKYGQFDVVLCLGLLYHLDAEDAVELLKSLFEVCRNFALIDTQIAVRPDEARVIDGRTYAGWKYREHPEGASPEAKIETLGASLEDDFSFWFSKPSLLNALRAAGFTSVLECLNPLDNMYLNGEFKMHEDYLSLIALKGPEIGEILWAHPRRSAEVDWPESASPFYLQRPWSPHPVQNVDPVDPVGQGAGPARVSRMARLWGRIRRGLALNDA